MLSTITDLLDQYLISSWDKQMVFAEFIKTDIGDYSWELDTENVGRLTLTGSKKTVAYEAQLLGTVSHSTNTWLWAWGSNKKVLQDCNLLRQYGKENKVQAFTRRTFNVNTINLDHLALVATGICNAGAYFRCTYERGFAFILIKDSSYDPSSIVREPLLLINYFNQLVLANLFQDHKQIFTKYFTYYGFVLDEDSKDALTAKSAACNVTAYFYGTTLNHIGTKLIQ